MLNFWEVCETTLQSSIRKSDAPIRYLLSGAGHLDESELAHLSTKKA